jgi:hypothetical protein
MKKQSSLTSISSVFSTPTKHQAFSKQAKWLQNNTEHENFKDNIKKFTQGALTQSILHKQVVNWALESRCVQDNKKRIDISRSYVQKGGLR